MKIEAQAKNGFLMKKTCSGCEFESCCSHLINKCLKDKTNNMQLSKYLCDNLPGNNSAQLRSTTSKNKLILLASTGLIFKGFL